MPARPDGGAFVPHRFFLLVRQPPVLIVGWTDDDGLVSCLLEWPADHSGGLEQCLQFLRCSPAARDRVEESESGAGSRKPALPFCRLRLNN